MNRLRSVVRVTQALVVSIGFAGCASPTPAPSREPAELSPPSVPAATGTAVPAATGTVLPTSTATVVPASGEVDLAGIAWVYQPPPTVLGGPDGGYTVQAGTLADDEPVVDLQVPWRALGGGPARQPAVGAPRGGAVVYVADDGAGSEVHRAEIAPDGADEVLATLGNVIWDIVVAPDGSVAYAAVVARADLTRDLGVVRILLDGSGSVEPFLPPAPLGAADAVRRVAELAFQIHLAMSSDGEHLLRRTCREAGTCMVQVVDLATGISMELPDREVLGVAAGVIVARRCGVETCELEAIDVETRAIASAGVDVYGPVIAVAGGPAVVAVLSDGRGTVTVEAVDPASGRSDVVHRVHDGTDVIYGEWLDLQMDLPAGFIHVIEMTPVKRHLLISVAEKRAFEIPAPAFRQPPGFGTQG